MPIAPAVVMGPFGRVFQPDLLDLNGCGIETGARTGANEGPCRRMSKAE